MSSTKLTTESSYQSLVQDLGKILQQGQQSALNAVNEIRLKTYWEMGKRLSQAKELADPSVSSSLFNQLAADLSMQVTLLYRVQQFYHLWPKGVPPLPKNSTLSWSHFVELVSVTDKKEREFYFKTAATQNWSRDQLRRAIHKDFFNVSQSPKQLKGKEDTLDRSKNPLHVYKAIVEKVVDGDTLLIRIDLGFEVWVNVRTRFRGINTAEIVRHGVPTSQAPDRGEEAKVFVEKKLEGLPFVVIKTYKTDMYGRYVVDVFYHPTLSAKEEVALKGFFLNDQLLKAGLADLMS